MGLLAGSRAGESLLVGITLPGAANHLRNLRRCVYHEQFNSGVCARENPEYLVCKCLAYRFDSIEAEYDARESLDSHEQALCLRAGDNTLIAVTDELYRGSRCA